MRIGKITAMMAAVAVAAFASSASAQVFSTTASPTVTGGAAAFSGSSVTLQQSTTLSCAVSATLNIAGSPGASSGTLSPRAIAPGASPFCGFLVFPVGSWSAATISGQTIPSAPGSALVTVTVGANTILNDPCNAQPVQATLSTTSTGSTLTFNNVTLQAQSGRPDRVCRINGVLSSSTPVYIF